MAGNPEETGWAVVVRDAWQAAVESVESGASATMAESPTVAMIAAVAAAAATAAVAFSNAQATEPIGDRSLEGRIVDETDDALARRALDWKLDEARGVDVRRTKRWTDYVTSLRGELQRVTAERDELRAMITDGPHLLGCVCAQCRRRRGRAT